MGAAKAVRKFDPAMRLAFPQLDLNLQDIPAGAVQQNIFSCSHEKPNTRLAADRRRQRFERGSIRNVRGGIGTPGPQMQAPCNYKGSPVDGIHRKTRRCNVAAHQLRAMRDAE